MYNSMEKTLKINEKSRKMTKLRAITLGSKIRNFFKIACFFQNCVFFKNTLFSQEKRLKLY